MGNWFDVTVYMKNHIPEFMTYLYDKGFSCKITYTARKAFSTLNIKQDGTSAGFLTFVD